jgi:hypothetical protein
MLSRKRGESDDFVVPDGLPFFVDTGFVVVQPTNAIQVQIRKSLVFKPSRIDHQLSTKIRPFSSSMEVFIYSVNL